MLRAAPKGITKIIKSTSYRNGFFSIKLPPLLSSVKNMSGKKMSDAGKTNITASLWPTQCVMFSIHLDLH